MRAGQVDVGVLTAYEAVLLTATRSLELHLIAGSGAAGQANTFMVIARDSIGSLDQLRGKSFAVARPGSYDDSLTKQFFSARGVETSEIQFLALGDPNVRVQALIAGRVDATLTSVSTWVSIRNEKGSGLTHGFTRPLALKGQRDAESRRK
jgi:NitT/TauT family transport system substrate-binding protein